MTKFIVFFLFLSVVFLASALDQCKPSIAKNLMNNKCPASVANILAKNSWNYRWVPPQSFPKNGLCVRQYVDPRVENCTGARFILHYKDKTPPVVTDCLMEDAGSCHLLETRGDGKFHVYVVLTDHPSVVGWYHCKEGPIESGQEKYDDGACLVTCNANTSNKDVMAALAQCKSTLSKAGVVGQLVEIPVCYGLNNVLCSGGKRC